MKTSFYTLLAAGGLLLFALSPAPASARRPLLTDSPAETQRKSAARERVAVAKKAATLNRATAHKSSRMAFKLSHTMRAVLRMDERKSVTSPLERNRQLHLLQKQLRAKACHESRARQARCIRQLN